MFLRTVTILQIAVIVVCPMWCAGGLCLDQCCDLTRCDLTRCDVVQNETNTTDSGCEQKTCCDAWSEESAIASNRCGDGLYVEDQTRMRCQTGFDVDMKESSPGPSSPDQSCPCDSYPAKTCQCICGGAVFEKPVEADRFFESSMGSMFDSDVVSYQNLRFIEWPDASLCRYEDQGNVGRFMRMLQHSFVI